MLKWISRKMHLWVYYGSHKDVCWQQSHEKKIKKNILSGLCGNYKHMQSRVLIAISPCPANWSIWASGRSSHVISVWSAEVFSDYWQWSLCMLSRPGYTHSQSADREIIFKFFPELKVGEKVIVKILEINYFFPIQDKKRKKGNINHKIKRHLK